MFLCFTTELEEKKNLVFSVVIDNCVGREGKALYNYCSETRNIFERKRTQFRKSPLQASTFWFFARQPLLKL